MNEPRDEPVIRLLREVDVDDLAAAAADGDPVRVGEWKQTLRKWTPSSDLATASAFALVAARDGCPVGFLLLQEVTSYWEIWGLGVAGPHRRHGIATALVGAAAQGRRRSEWWPQGEWWPRARRMLADPANGDGLGDGLDQSAVPEVVAFLEALGFRRGRRGGYVKHWRQGDG